MNESLVYHVARRFGPAVLGVVALFVVLFAARPAAAQSDWYHANWHFRVPVSIGADGVARVDKVAEVELDFAAMLASKGYTNPLLPESIKVIEVDSGNAVVDAGVPFQFDGTSGKGALSLLMKGHTGAAQTRHYHVYFDVGGSFTAPSFSKEITLTQNVTDESFNSYKLEGKQSTLFYHTEGGGFSSLNDASGVDWINWSKATGDAGDFRGIPNLVHPNDGGYFHPGRTTASSAILFNGPLRVSILSTSDGGGWQTRWDVFPTYARMTVVKKPTTPKYWFQYEGTPGGVLQNTDHLYRSDGRDVAGLGTLSRDIDDADEWQYITDANSGPDGRSFFMAHYKSDTIVDSYWPLGSMTIMSFGRDTGNGRYFTAADEQFAIGLINSVESSAVALGIREATEPLAVTVGVVQQEGDPNPPATPVVFKPVHDSYVASNYPTKSYGSLSVLRVKNASVDMVTYLKFDVTGLAAAPQSAKLRLYVTDPSPDGGSVYSVSNDYLGTAMPWVESGLKWTNAPAISGPPVASVGATLLNKWVEVDVSPVITGDGAYSFALSSASANIAVYTSSEGARSPELVITPAAP